MISQTVDVETPELVVLTYTVAGVGSRAAAALIDYLISVLFIIMLFVLFVAMGAGGVMAGASPDAAVGWAMAVLAMAQFIVLWGYYVLFEALADGQTPGKRYMKLRVVRDGGLSITFGASAVRNLVRIIDMQPAFFYGVGIFSVAFQKEGKRLGDIAAGTLVVKEEALAAPAVAIPRREGDAPPMPTALHTALTDREFDLLDHFAKRSPELAPEVRARFAASFHDQLAHALKGVEGDTEASRLLRLHADETRARAAGAAARHGTGAARERHAIIATNAPRWAGFSNRLAAARKGGLRRLGEDGVREFVQEYRELTADLARLRTASKGASVPEVFYLNRLVATAHNLLYRRRAIPTGDIAVFLFDTVPREIRASARPILLAAALLFTPMAVAGIAVARDADAAAAFLPPQMFDRVEDGLRAAERGTGYVDVPEIYRPTMASQLIANNVQVAFLAFAAGISAGILTVFVLVMNGVSIGAVIGLYVAKGIPGLMLAFIAPHGPFELSAICIAGGAGLLLGKALVLPGNRTRRRALVENAQRAARLVAGSVLLLLFAGLIEGFVSPIPYWPLALKLVFAATMLVLLYVYLRLGAGRAPLAGVRAPRAP